MTYEPFSLRTRKQVEAMGSLAYWQHANNYNWVESWYKASQVRPIDAK